MHKSFVLSALVLSIAIFAIRGDDTTTAAPAIAPKPLVDFTATGVEGKFTPTKEATVAPSTSPAGVTVTIQPSTSKFPGVALKPDGGNWDLSPFGHIEAVITNTSARPIRLALRIDGATWQDSRAAITLIKPGETGTAKVWFTGNYGQPAGQLKASTLSELLFVAPPAKDAAYSFRIESVQAAGAAGEMPPIDKATIRITPPGGVLVGPGAKPLDPVKNIAAKGGAAATLADASGAQVLQLTFPAGKPNASAGIKPEEGKWGLTDGIEVRAKVRNDGPAPVTPTLHVDSNGGPIEAVASSPLAPGAETELVADYRNPKIWQNPPQAEAAASDTPAAVGDNTGKSTSAAVAAMPSTGNVFTSNQVTDVVFLTDGGADAKLTVESIKADMPPITTPDWLGKKPPVDGDWVMTLDEQFKGKEIDQARWNVKGPNYYDQRTHWSPEEVIVKPEGGAIIRFEKKTGRQNDDPAGKENDYATGYLDSFGKWTQRYGYFECKMKLPGAAGLWPAFWLMPDRGESVDHRTSTKFGGMEFDILEHLTGWGPNRYNIANHWDGYGKEHKATGNDRNYVEPDKDGYITAGLLWTPGTAVYYGNGKELLRFTSDRISNVQEDILFTMPTGGWDNLPLDDAKLPTDWTLEYVRVWQRKDLATPEDGAHTPTKPIPDH